MNVQALPGPSATALQPPLTWNAGSSDESSTFNAVVEPLASAFFTVTEASPPTPAVTSSGASGLEGGVNDNVPPEAASATFPVEAKPNVSRATADEVARMRRNRRGVRNSTELTRGSDQRSSPRRLRMLS